MISAAAARPVWQEPWITGINRLRARSVKYVYANGVDALAEKKEQRQSLNGEWKFKMVEHPSKTPADFIKPNYKDAKWDEVTVPGNFTMQGYGYPHYTNVRMPFDERPPFTPERNLTGLYRTSFSVPKSFKNKRLILRFGSIDQVGQIWLNGEAVGVVKDSRLPSEFDITDLVKDGENCLAVQVIQFSDAAFIEDQDQWWQAGIARDVDLIACNDTYIEDVFANANLHVADGSGDLDLFVRAAHVAEAGWTIKADMYDAKGKAFGKSMSEEVQYFTGPHPHGGRHIEGTATLLQDFKKVLAWSHEEPHLYTLIVRLYNPNGKEVEATRFRIGFTHVETKDRELLLNGKPVMIKGVNRHEHDERKGKAISRELMRKDVEVLKAHNVNAVRTSHYPPDDYFFELCDEYGLWCIDETNIETHHFYNDLCNDPQYATAFLDRGMRMVLRDRNHPCIFSWSLGNESGHGPNHDAMAAWMRKADPSRIIHYEGAICGDRGFDGGHEATDIVCPMYPSIARIVQWRKESEDNRPFIMCEFVHAMGNSCGGLKDYWDAFEAHHGLQGGFIWEMLDHGIVQSTKDGEEYWAYGGDFGDTPNDINFVCDGLVWPDRTPHSSFKEAKAIYQPVAVELSSPTNNEISIYNKHDFIDLSHYRIEWELLADGEVIDSGRLPRLDIKPGKRRLVRIPGRVPTQAQDKLCHINVHFYDTRDSDLVGKDYYAAVCQVELPQLRQPIVLASDLDEKVICEQGKRMALSVGDSQLIFDQDSGLIESWSHNDVKLLQASAKTDIWRAATDNDGLKLREHMRVDPKDSWVRILRHWLWQEYDQCNRAVDACKLRQSGSEAILQWRERTWGRDKAKVIKTQHQLRMGNDGSLSFEHVFNVAKGLPELPRIGVQFEVPAGFEDMEWFGLGPIENYSDRKACARMGTWSSSISDQYVPYIVPQEHGHIADLRRLRVRNANGAGFEVIAESHCEANLSHYDNNELYDAKHTTEIAPKAHSFLNLDAAHRGLGTGSCGPDTLEAYQVQPGTYRLAYTLKPLA